MINLAKLVIEVLDVKCRKGERVRKHSWLNFQNANGDDCGADVENLIRYAKTNLNLRTAYQDVIDSYVDTFIRKQGFNSDDWDFALIENNEWFANIDYNFKLNDIRFDIDTNQPKGLILQWFDSCVEMIANNAGFLPTYQMYAIEQAKLKEHQ